MNRESEVGIIAAVTAFLLAVTPATTPLAAQQVTGRVGFAESHDYDRREATPGARAEIRRSDQQKCSGFEALVAATNRAA